MDPAVIRRTWLQLFGFLRLLSYVVGAVFLFVAGNRMGEIRSVSGESINEAFYQAMGVFARGLGTVCCAMAFGALTDMLDRPPVAGGVAPPRAEVGAGEPNRSPEGPAAVSDPAVDVE